ncbi:MAG: hypothetical protein ABIH03_17420, partial [Pseudomonadota bacterium]
DGAGTLVVRARHVVVTAGGVIRASGEAGAAAVAGNCGGGGGGGGGVVYLTCSSYSGAAPSAVGGALGAGFGTGVDGTAGAAGYVSVVTV